MPSAAVTPTAAQGRRLPAAGEEAKQSVTTVCPFVTGQGCCQDWNRRYRFPRSNLSVPITELLWSNVCDTVSTRGYYLASKDDLHFFLFEV